MEFIIILAVIIAVINSFANAAKKKTEAQRREAQRREAQRQWWQAESEDGEGDAFEPQEPQLFTSEAYDDAPAAQAGDYNMPSAAGEQADFDGAGMVYAQDIAKHADHQHQGYAYVNEAGMYEGAPLPGRGEGARQTPAASPSPARVRGLAFGGNPVVAGIIYSELLARVTPGVPPHRRNR